MNELEFSFGAAPWEAYLDTVSDSASAATLLALMEGQSEEDFEDLLLELEQRRILIDIADLPRPTGTGEAAVRLRLEEQLARQGLPVHKMESGDPLRLYLEELAATPAAGDADSTDKSVSWPRGGACAGICGKRRASDGSDPGGQPRPVAGGVRL